jgi:hypothetical protein
MYVKLIKDGTPDIPLAPEEVEALEQARGAGPFTIRPRVGASDDGKTAVPEIDADTAALLSSGLPGRRPPSEREVARENRRRKRQGLPPVVERVTPSATGWTDPVTPSPRGDSLAAQYVRQRKAGTGGAPAKPVDSDYDGDGDIDDV